jgi:hypothetical protein
MKSKTACQTAVKNLNQAPSSNKFIIDYLGEAFWPGGSRSTEVTCQLRRRYAKQGQRGDREKVDRNLRGAANVVCLS